MLKILGKGNQISLDLDTTAFTGDVAHDSALAGVTELVGGRVVGLTAGGKVQLCDGAVTTTQHVGFLINDAAGYFFENKPAIASGLVSTTFGNCIVVTDQIDTSKTFAAGQKLYAGTGAVKGLLTNVAPDAAAAVVGIAGSAASAASPELKVFVV